MFQTNGQRGKKLIAGVSEVINSITKQLKDGIALCIEEKNYHHAAIETAHTEMAILDISIEDGEKMLANIAKLTGKEV